MQKIFPIDYVVPLVEQKPTIGQMEQVSEVPTRKENGGVLVNQAESRSFLETALAWQGSVTPRVMQRVGFAACYASMVYVGTLFWGGLSLPITPFEYSGAVLGLLLVLRVNAGHDRWWEARKIWGSVVNQSRNLAIAVKAYGSDQEILAKQVMLWVAALPHAMRESLRNQRNLDQLNLLLGYKEAEGIRSAEHMPSYVALKIAKLLRSLRDNGLDALAFHRLETERSGLIDAIGACERIKNTRMPFVLAVKTRRFILLFILLLPFALVDRAGWLTPLVVALTCYPLFSLDEIGAELQNPFSPRNLSHLPLDGICESIEKNIKAMINLR